MPLEKAVPILAFLDLEESVLFYQNLGFQCNSNWKEYLMCIRDDIEECQKLNIVHPNGPLKDQPWGMRQFSILDNSGNIINFGERLS